MIEWSKFIEVGNEASYLMDAFQSGWVSGGEYVGKLENSLELTFGSPKALTVANGTVALQLAFQSLGAKVGDEVIVPAFCFQAAGNVAVQLGLKPVFCDVDEASFNQTLSAIKRTYSKRTVGIVVVHNYGIAAAVEDICDWAKQKGLWVIEDVAEAWFSKFNGKYLGTYGDVATFSMHATKTIACGEGGVVLLNDGSLIDRAALIKSHGLNRQGTQYLHLLPGNNYRLSNLLCAVALAQFEQRQIIIERQIVNAGLFYELLSSNWAISFQQSLSAAVDVPWATAIKIKFEKLSVCRDGLIAVLEKKGIQTRPGFYSAKALMYHSEESTRCTSVADKLSESIIVLPTNGSIEAAQVENICYELLATIEQHSQVNSEFEFLNVLSESDWQLDLTGFLKGLDHGQSQFRYFMNRSLSVVNSHLKTLFLKECGDIVAYGHLESEDGRLWLGIAVSDEKTGKGWGKLMFSRLLSEAFSFTEKFEKISLRVDRSNHVAISMYKKFEFEIIQESNETKSNLLMERPIELL